MSRWRPENEAALIGSASMANRPARIVKVKAGPGSGVKPKALTVTSGKSGPVEVGRAVGGGGKVTMFKLNGTPAARQLENVLAQSTVATDIPTAKSVNVHVG